MHLASTINSQLDSHKPKRSHLETLRELTSRQATPPRKLQSTVPRDLEAICLKCLEFKPHQRYASGHNLAEDLDRYLAGLPVQARPASAISRLIKWSERKPLVASLTIALWLAIVVGFSLIAWQWQRTRVHYRRAQQSFRQAHQAVQEMHSLVYKDDDYDAPEFHPLRKEAVTLALKYYEQFQTQEVADAALIADIAGAYRDIGFIAHVSGSQTESLRLYRKSLGLWEQLTRIRSDHGGLVFPSKCSNVDRRGAR